MFQFMYLLEYAEMCHPVLSYQFCLHPCVIQTITHEEGGVVAVGKMTEEDLASFPVPDLTNKDRTMVTVGGHFLMLLQGMSALFLR